MADSFKGGATIAGYLALHEGMTQTSLAGDLTLAGSLTSGDLTANRALVTDANKKIISSSITSTKLGYLSDVTSAIQAQINSKLNLSGGTLTGNLTISKTNGRLILNETASSTGNSGIEFKTDVNQNCTLLHEVTDADLPATGQALILDGGSNVAHFVLKTGGEFYSGTNKVWHAGNLTPSNYLPTSGGTVTSNLTINGNLTVKGNTTIGNAASDTLTIQGNVTLPTTTSIGNVSSTEIGYLDGVTSNIQTQLGAANLLTKIKTVDGADTGLDADLLDGYHAKDIFNGTIAVGGYGVVSGCEVTGGNGNLTVRIAAGTVYIPNYGFKNIKANASLGGFSTNDYNLVFIAGETYDNYTQGNVGVKSGTGGWPVLQNKDILLARVRTDTSVISNDHIWDYREFLPIQTDNYSNIISIFKSGRNNQQVSSSSNSPIDRMIISKSGNGTNVTISSIPDGSNTYTKLTLKSNEIVLSSVNNQAVESVVANFQATDVNNWKNANTLKHTHYPNAGFTGACNGTNKNFVLDSEHNPTNTNVMVYKNGLRQKLGVDYTLSSRTVQFTDAPASGDTIVIDYIM